MNLSVIIPAAGQSSRMNSAVSKQLMKINGVEVLALTVQAFESLDIVKEIIIVCRESEKAEFIKLMKKYNITKLKAFVNGGETRQRSVLNSLEYISDDCDYIAVHDGARPLVSPELIENTAKYAELHGAAAPGIPVKDTIKIVDAQGFVSSTPNRPSLRAIQTPQIFLKKNYLKAAQTAINSAAEYTDDCAMLEAAGYRVYICEGSISNIKITTAEDIVFAERLKEAETLKSQ